MGGTPEILATLTLTEDGNIGNAPGITVGSLLVGIVPGNVVSPFATNNIMQTLFLVCFYAAGFGEYGHSGNSGYAFYRY